MQILSTEFRDNMLKREQPADIYTLYTPIRRINHIELVYDHDAMRNWEQKWLRRLQEGKLI